MLVLVTCKNVEDPIKTEELECSQGFPHYNPMGPIRWHGYQSCNDAPDETNINWPACLRDIYVQKCEQKDSRQLESHPISSHGVLSSAELKI